MTILLIAYGIFLLGLAAFGGSALYHAFSFGIPGDKSRYGAALYIIIVASILVLSFIFIGGTSFTATEGI